MVGNATTAHVLTGKMFTNNRGVGLTGTMPNQGTWTNTPTGSGKVTIPAGYHNGSGYVDTATVYTNGYNAGKSSVIVLTGSVTVAVNDVHQEVTVSFGRTLPSKPIVGCYSTDARLGATVIWPSTTGFTTSVYSEDACDGESIVLHWVAVCQ